MSALWLSQLGTGSGGGGGSDPVPAPADAEVLIIEGWRDPMFHPDMPELALASANGGEAELVVQQHDIVRNTFPDAAGIVQPDGRVELPDGVYVVGTLSSDSQIGSATGETLTPGDVFLSLYDIELAIIEIEGFLGRGFSAPLAAVRIDGVYARSIRLRNYTQSDVRLARLSLLIWRVSE